MNVDDLRAFSQTNSDYDLSKKLPTSKATISKWRAKGIPIGEQAILEILTKGQLKANRKLLAKRYKLETSL